jgi:low temperature requirement protein LtrA
MASAARRVSSLELFFDLVFVFAITQVSHLLLDDLSWRGAGRATIALLVVWWAWNYTTWVTNELDTERSSVRLLLLGLALGSLLLAVAIPHAFGSRGLLFAGAYVAIQVVRHGYLTFASGPGTIERERAGRILAWFCFAGVFWLAGAFVELGARGALWVVALAIDYGAPLVVFWLPGRGRIRETAWEVETAHFAERFQLFVIIALGESIVLTGATTAELELGAARFAAFVLAFASTAALWWLYFDYVATIAERRLELAGPRRTRIARDGYTYLHAAMVAGVIVSAVGDELAIAHPGETLPGREIVAVVAGPTIYLAAHALFRLRMAGALSWKRVAGAAGCAAAGLVGLLVPALALAGLVVAVLWAVIAAERIAGLRREARGEPSPLERLAEPSL